MKKFVTLLLMAAAVMFAGSAIALAAKDQIKTKNVQSKITLKYTDGDDPYGEDDNFHGKVSAKRDCDDNRKVKVYNKQTGARVGKAKTDESGRYTINASVPPGTYFAEVQERSYTVTKKNGKQVKYVCKAATSDKVVVE